MLYMKYLIIDTLSEWDSEGESVVESIKEISKDTEVVYADKLNIKNCCGCTYCWLKTPGVCAIKDDYHIVFEKFLSADNVIIIGESKLGFVSYKVKNIIDRILPIVLPYLTITEGEMRHLPRYDKTWNMALIYKNKGEIMFMYFVAFVFLFALIMLCVALICVPIMIANARGITGNEKLIITILSWLGILFGVTWIIALVLSLVWGNPKDNLENLEKLSKLYKDKIITKEEFLDNLTNANNYLEDLIVEKRITRQEYFDHILLPLKFGTVSMASKTNAMIVPYAITGDYKFRSKNLTVRIGKPFAPGNDLAKANEKLDKAIKDLMKENLKK